MTNLPMNKLIDEVNNELSVARNKSVMDTQLEESMLYSLNAGGKRIRPVLLLLTLDSLNTEYEFGVKSAMALEMIHTYSLIHDDLLAMDTDDYRRGKLTNHKGLGEW
ncbi:polyprenyl synthetase family protein, partial [Staphylococcus aureus]|uniref:polyprenyl synthetase family protein n=1 Tax=Staphylococcus aureus TaxID=1280 RepID=UPI003D1FA82B